MTAVVIDGHETLVDEDIAIAMGEYQWFAMIDRKGAGGVLGQKNRKASFTQERPVKLPRLVTGARPKQIVDHIDGNTFDNRRQNLRLVTKAQNCMNSAPRPGGASKYKNVVWCKNTGKWRSRAKVNRRVINGKRFVSEIDAARHADKMAREHYGEYARLNFPLEHQS